MGKFILEYESRPSGVTKGTIRLYYKTNPNELMGARGVVPLSRNLEALGYATEIYRQSVTRSSARLVHRLFARHKGKLAAGKGWEAQRDTGDIQRALYDPESYRENKWGEIMTVRRDNVLSHTERHPGEPGTLHVDLHTYNMASFDLRAMSAMLEKMAKRVTVKVVSPRDILVGDEPDQPVYLIRHKPNPNYRAVEIRAPGRPIPGISEGAAFAGSQTITDTSIPLGEYERALNSYLAAALDKEYGRIFRKKKGK